ncbi:DNA-directed RNA polymerase I core subunit rpa12 [Ascosphaera acerosa]|nr:DNA-directed RNA polymerase I core subunit rpa12 [Ascosphaera acerosa]
MSAIGSLIFCTSCGNLLPESSGDENAIIPCDVCGTQNKDIPPRTITSVSKPSAFPSALRSKRSAIQTLSSGDRNHQATIQETCEKCGNPEVLFTTLQLRSADEGTTVFYTCPKCGHKWSTNN